MHINLKWTLFGLLALPYQKSPAQFNVNLVNSDATSVTLSWSPFSNIKNYVVYRDSVEAGITVSKTGYFSDYGLVPDHNYHYRVVPVTNNNDQLAVSETILATTKSSSTIRTHYKVLAVAFYPATVDMNELTGIKTYFKHRLDFFKLASMGSAVIEPFKNDIVTIKATPKIKFVGEFNIDYKDLVTTPYKELNGYSIIDLIERGDIDFVWVTKAPDQCKFFENYLLGNRDIGTLDTKGERWIAERVGCSRSFFVNAYLPDDRCNDAYCHMIEGIMSSICDSYPDTWPRDNPYQVNVNTRWNFTTLINRNLHLFERFRLTDQWNGGVNQQFSSPGNGNCGSSHFPPNSRRDIDANYDGNYAYYDQKTWSRYIDCFADDWFNFPEFKNIKRKLNGYDFGAFNCYQLNDQPYSDSFGTSPENHPSFTISPASYHLWWFNHLPHNSGVSKGRLNNWWPYIYDFNRFNGSSIEYAVNGFPSIPHVFNAVNSEYGTDEDTPGNWGYWHTQNGFSPFGKYGRLSVISKSTNPAQVKNGNYSIKITVENSETFEYADKGANAIFYPVYRNARWNLSDLDSIQFSVKLDQNPDLIIQTNPVIKLCTNGGNRIELVPLKNGVYANLFQNVNLKDKNGWYNFSIPVRGNKYWEKNIIGYIDPEFDATERAAARFKLEREILREVNYIEIDIKSNAYTIPVEVCTFLIDDLQFHLAERNPLAPSEAGFINGDMVVCQNTSDVVYTVPVIAGAISYVWELPSGASGSSSTNTISVNYGINAASGEVKVRGHNDYGDGAECALPVKVSLLPSAAGNIDGETAVCKNASNVIYTIPEINQAISYSWDLPAGASGTSNTNSITLNFNDTLNSGDITVKGFNTCGYGAGSKMSISFLEVPQAPVINISEGIMQSNATSGNQWYFNNRTIQNAVKSSYIPDKQGTYYVIVTLNTCSSQPSNTISYFPTSMDGTLSQDMIVCYPNPTTAKVEISTSDLSAGYRIEVFNTEGLLIQNIENQRSNKPATIDLDGYPSGIYLIVIHTTTSYYSARIIKK